MASARSLVDRFFGFPPRESESQRSLPLSWDVFQSYFNYNGTLYPLQPSMTMGEKQEEPDPSFTGYVQAIYRSNGIVFACMEARRLIFSEARFQYRQLRSGRLGDLFGNPSLAPLEKPWPNGTTGDLLSRAIQDVDLSGNFYAVRQGDQILRMRPDWVTIVLGSDMSEDTPSEALDAQVIGYVYKPGGSRSLSEPVVLRAEQVAHWAPTVDPLARFRGMSWLTPVVREIMADAAATQHKLKFFENGATVNLALTYPEGMTKDLFDAYVEAFERGHRGIANAYSTLHLGGGATPTPVGADMQQIEFKVTQGAGETRIAAAARVPPIIVGLSEGLAAATYSNYGMARRAFADLTMRPLWRDLAGSLATIIDVPPDAMLWYDDRDIPFLQEDVKDDADIKAEQAQTIRTLVDAGFEPPSVIDAVTSGDFARLVHTGLFSVQLQPPGTPEPSPSTNGAVTTPIGATSE